MFHTNVSHRVTKTSWPSALGFPPTAIIFFCLYMMTCRHPDPDSGLHFVISCYCCSSFQTLNCWGGTTGGWRGTVYWATKILFPSLVAVEHFVLTLTITFGFMQNSEPTGQDYIDCSLHFIFDNLPPTCPPTYPAFQELQKTFCNSWTMFVDLQVLFHFCAIQLFFFSFFFSGKCVHLLFVQEFKLLSCLEIGMQRWTWLPIVHTAYAEHNRFHKACRDDEHVTNNYPQLFTA